MKHLVAAVTALVLTSPAHAQTYISYPENPNPLTAAHLGVAPESAWIAPEGTVRVSGDFSWANTFLHEPNYSVDAETRALALGAAYGVSPSMEVGLELPVVWRGGGSLDHLIRSWHEWFNLPEGNRESVDDDRFDIHGIRNDGNSYLWDEDGTSLGSAKIFARFEIDSFRSNNGGGAHSTTINLQLSLPTAEHTYGHAGIDGGVVLEHSQLIDRWQLHIGAGGFFLTDDEVQGVGYRRARAEGFLGADYKVLESLRLGVNLFGGQQSVEDVRTYPGAFLYSDVGIFWQSSQELQLKLIVRENPWPSDGTTDIAFILGIDLLSSLHS